MQRRIISNILDDFLNSFVEYPVYYVSMPEIRSDIRKTKDGFELDLPGFEKEQIEISIKAGTLHVEAKSKDRTVSRMVSLSKMVDTEDVKAHYRNGVLTIAITSKEVLEKKIEIE